MKKKCLFALTLSLIFILALAGCGGKDSPGGQTDDNDASLIPPAKVEMETEFRKALAPLKYREEEMVEGLYHKTVYADGEAYYEVQPDGESEPLRIPVSDTVIYDINEGENYIEKVTLKPGESREVTLTLAKKDMGFYNDEMEYCLEDGAFIFYVGGNSRDCLKEERRVAFEK